MDRQLEELQIIRDKTRKEFNIACDNLFKYKLFLINKELNSNYTEADLSFWSDKKCIHSPIDLCVYLEDPTENDCLFCGEEE